MAKFELTLRLVGERTYKFQIAAEDIDSATQEAEGMIESLHNGTNSISKDWGEGLESFEWELEDLDEL